MMQRNMPIGYKMIDGKILLDESKASVIKKIFADYLSGTTIHGIANGLTQMGVLNSSGKHAWTHASIGNILKNVRYLGDEIYPQMIDHGVFTQVQKRREDRCEQLGRSIQPNSMKQSYPFTGKLRCGECGAIYRRYIEHSGNATEKSLWKCKRYIYKNRVCFRCGVLTDSQVEKAFLNAVNRIITRIQILDRKPKKEPIPNNPEFHKLDQQIKELEAEGQYSSKELPVLIYKRAKACYQTAQIDDTDFNTEKMKQALSGISFLMEFDKDLFLTLVRQVTVYADHRLVFEFINGLTIETEY